MKYLEYITKWAILPKSINWISKNCHSNWNPYHNFNHVFTVFLFVSKHLDELKSEKECELLLAALFHDYNHSGGEFKDDSLNINKAADGLIKFHLHFLLDSYTKDLDWEFTLDLIFATRYPYNIEDDKLPKEAHLLRDADLAYLFSPIAIPMTMGALRAEMGIDLENFYKTQQNFINSLKFRIHSVEKEWQTIKQNRLDELKLLEGVL